MKITTGDEEPTIEIKGIMGYMMPIMDIISGWKGKYIKKQGKILQNEKNETGPLSESVLKKIDNWAADYFFKIYDNLVEDKKSRIERIPTHLSKDNSDLARMRGDYDYVLIDEAQDWKKTERDILFKLFGPEKIIIADGGNQLIRSNQELNWKASNGERIPHTIIPLRKKSLRQKAKHCTFQQLFAPRFNVNWKVEKNEKIGGGEILIHKGEMNESFFSILKEKSKHYSKDNYDNILFLTPPHYSQKVIQKTQSTYKGETIELQRVAERSFKYKAHWESMGINVFDMTKRTDKKTDQPEMGDYRLINYESCRGLESYAVVALEMDKFFESKIKHYNEEEDAEKQGDVFAQTFDDKAMRYAAMWSLIVFSRPVDLLVITINDENSLFYRVLEQINEENPNLLTFLN